MVRRVILTAATVCVWGGGAMGASAGSPAVTAVRITQTAASLTIDRVSGQVWEKVVHDLDGSESTSLNGLDAHAILRNSLICRMIPAV